MLQPASGEDRTDGYGEKGNKQETGNAAFMKPVQSSADLAAVVGGDPKPRTEVTKKIWYIKSNKLQDPDDGRKINADDKLRPV